jgi:hypothetical protein
MHKGYPDGDPESEAMLVHHFNREHDIPKQPASSLHEERPDNGDMPMNSKTRCAYPVDQLAAQKLSLTKRGTSGLEPAEDKEMCVGRKP